MAPGCERGGFGLAETDEAPSDTSNAATEIDQDERSETSAPVATSPGGGPESSDDVPSQDERDQNEGGGAVTEIDQGEDDQTSEEAEPGGEADTDGTGETKDDSEGDRGDETYSWFLPADPLWTGDVFTTLTELRIASDLSGTEPTCGSAAERLDDGWFLVSSPRAVLTFQAAIDACRSDVPSARATFERAQSSFGFEGVFGAECDAYRSLLSVLEQRERDGVSCSLGNPVQWPSEDVDRRDDPRTPMVDESLVPEVGGGDVVAPDETQDPTGENPPAVAPVATSPVAKP